MFFWEGGETVEVEVEVLDEGGQNDARPGAAKKEAKKGFVLQELSE